jgi:effector-binding domain-containing protein
MKTKSLKKFGLFSLLILAVSFSAFDYLNEPDKKKCETKIEIKNVESQKGLVIKVDVPTSEIGAKMGELYGQLFGYMGANNITPAGPPFAVYYSYEPEGNTVFEAGVPVQSKVAGSGNIVFKEFPVMKVVSTLYKGAYEEMEPVYISLDQYIKDNELESTGTCWEIYLTDPKEVASPDDNQTLVYFPIK